MKQQGRSGLWTVSFSIHLFISLAVKMVNGWLKREPELVTGEVSMRAMNLMVDGPWRV